MPACSSYPCFHLLCALFSHLSSVTGCLYMHTVPLSGLHDFVHWGMSCSVLWGGCPRRSATSPRLLPFTLDGSIPWDFTEKSPEQAAFCSREVPCENCMCWVLCCVLYYLSFLLLPGLETPQLCGCCRQASFWLSHPCLFLPSLWASTAEHLHRLTHTLNHHTLEKSAGVLCLTMLYQQIPLWV